jgi:hypothetical protein
MATQFCECGSGLNNLGVSSCPSIMKTIKKHIFVSLYNSNGERNSIKLTDFDANGILPDTYVAGRLHTLDGSERWYPTPGVYENVESTRTDTTTEEFQSGLTVRIQNGVQTFMGSLIQVEESLASRILSNGCSDFGVYEIDKDGSLRGEMSADGEELYPIKINKGSLDSYSVPEVEGTSVQRVMVTFQFDGTVSEIDLKKIANSQIEPNMLQIASMIDGVLDLTDGQTSTASNLFVDFDVKFGGTFGSPIPIQGQTDVASWSLIDSSLSSVTISSVTEGNKGEYDFSITGVTAPETLKLSYVPNPASKSDDQEFESNIFTIVLV